MVPILVTMEDAISKFLVRSMKSKQLKMETMVGFDEDTKHWIVDIAKPKSDKDATIASDMDYTIERVYLGVRTR